MRRRLPLIFVVVSTLLICLIVAFINNSTVIAIDAWAYQEVVLPMNPNLTLIMMFITQSGSTLTLIILCASLFLFNRTRKWAIPISATVIIATLSNTILKLIFGRERPDILQLVQEYDHSFPSGHAMTNMAFYVIIFLIANKTIKNKKLRIGISIMCIALPILIGISRIYLGVHYATDVIAGWLLGFIISVIVFKIFERWKHFLNMRYN